MPRLMILINSSSLLKQINLLGSIGDDKYLRLKELIDPAAAKPETALPKDVATPELKSQKVLVFTEFADTARYLHTQLVNDGLTDIDRLDGSRTGDRVKMIKRFAPLQQGHRRRARCTGATQSSHLD